jgi:hypothetical protein
MDLETLGYYLFMQQQEEEQKQSEEVKDDLEDVKDWRAGTKDQN